MEWWPLGEELTPPPVDYVVIQTTIKETSVGDHFWVFLVQLLSVLIHYEDFIVLLMCLRFCVERFKESRVVQDGVRVPLLYGWGEKCVSKEFLVFTDIGRAVLGFPRRGRVTKKKSKHSSTRKFDNTRGYPDEDILSCTLTCFGC